ncbi:tetratricopeptide repeat protein [Herbaspirillum sp. alder98]|uniref:tetratricopeptide repeat protein n=1 Tax=Herbaspirillum sp. alder98 TaxID=2913096 RepID=UPI001CD8588B|nr:tetratricopeptide repeat protein [Herbaspirillum sp. alder98]MCA1324823.1 tetratricopeptide repeat protein [Herbaspirillum sp. alder98]
MPQPANAATPELQQALALHQKQQYRAAEELYKKVLKKAPRHFEANYLYGMLKLHQQDWEGAQQQLALAINLNPAHVGTYLDHATALQHLDRHDEALKSLDHALALNPDFTEARLSQGDSLRQSGRARAALDAFERVLKGDNDNADAWFQRGNAQYDLKRLRDAAQSYERAVELRPDFVEALFNLANTQKDTAQLETALQTYDRAIKAAPEFAIALVNRGYVLSLLDRTEEALESYERAAEIDDTLPELWFNRGATMEDLRRYDEALGSYQRAQSLDPEGASAHWNESLVRLLQGDYSSGWKKYEWRWRTEQMSQRQLELDVPLWLGEESLRGKTILLHAEQGYGDTLQFSRYVTQVAARGASVILQVQGPLRNLLANLPGVVEVLSSAEKPKRPFDFHCPLMSLPLACGMQSDDDIPRAPYLTADPRKWAAWYQRLPQTRALRVGLVWFGSSATTNPSAVRIDNLRSVPFDTLAPIVELAREYAGLEFYSLQVDRAAVVQLKAHPLADLVKDFSSELHDFGDTAALVSNLDLIISVDTAACHLAGALGKPVWLLNRTNTCWRWQMDRTDTPWYQNFTIFRQTARGDWSDVIEQMREALAQHMSER